MKIQNIAHIVLIGFALNLGQALAADTKVITVNEGKLTNEQLPYVVERFKVGDAGMVKVEKIAENQIRVIGVRSGETSLQIFGEGIGPQDYTVIVRPKEPAIIEVLRFAVERLPEVEIEVVGTEILLQGEINSIGNWKYYRKVRDAYQGQFKDFVRFRPAPDLLVRLEKSLQKWGFKVSSGPTTEAMQEGVLHLQYEDNKVFISGKVYSQTEIENIRSAIRTQPWLKLFEFENGASTNRGFEPPGSAPETTFSDEEIYGIMQVSLVASQIELDVAFVLLSESETKRLGTNLAKNGLIAVDTTGAFFEGIIGRNRSSGFGGNYAIRGTFNDTLNFVEKITGPQRKHIQAHLSFPNGTDEEKVFRSGKTEKVLVPGGVGGESNLEDVVTGLTLAAKGNLVGAQTIRIDGSLKMDFKNPNPDEVALFDIQDNEVDISFVSPANQTIVLGGIREKVRDSSGNRTPIVGKIPLIKYLFSEETKVKEDRYIVVLASPRLTGTFQGITPAAPKSLNEVSLEEPEALKDVKKPSILDRITGSKPSGKK